MCSHIRFKRRANGFNKDFKDSVETMDTTPLKASLCPLLAFRIEAEEEEREDSCEQDPDDDVIAVYFDSHLMSARKLFGSGRLEEPLWYEPGNAGFVVA